MQDQSRTGGCRGLTALLALGLVTASLLLAPRPAAASPGWELILDRPTPDFGSIDFVSDSEGWLVAGAGLLHTTNGGATWQEAAPLRGTDVAFADADHGWLVGIGGAIYATADGGGSWSQQESGTRVHLQDLAALSATEAWAVGTGEGFSDVAPTLPPPNAFLHTTDGGATWEQVATPPASWFREITFVGQQGWLLGEQCSQTLYSCLAGTTRVLLHTADGGETWSLNSDVPQNARNLIFANEQLGWMLGHQQHTEGPSPAVFRTTDGGTTWEALPITAQHFESYVGLAFRDASTGWLFVQHFARPERETIEVRKTVDAGMTWATVSEMALEGQQYVRRVTSAARDLYITGNGLALRSTDGGATWHQPEHPALDLFGVDFVDRRVGFAMSGDQLLRTDDAGRSWRRVSPLPARPVRIEFLDGARGFAANSDCGEAGCSVTVLRTNDGGSHWMAIFSQIATKQASMFPIDLHFADAEHGWLVVEGGGIFLTSDGGRTWEQHSFGGRDVSVTDAELVDAGFAWALVVPTEPGARARQILHSRDGGRTWNLVGIASIDDPERVDFKDRDHGWYVVTRCQPFCRVVVSATEDGGATWTEADLGPLSVYDFLFVDRLNGWLNVSRCDEQCRYEVLHTADGGKTWASQQSGDNLRGRLFFVDVQTGWLQPFQTIGLGGGPPQRTLLYHTTDGGGGPIGRILPDVGAGPEDATPRAAPAALALLALGGALALTAVRMRRTRA